MQHHERSFDARGKLQRLEGVLDGGFAFAVRLSGKLVKVRRGMIHAHRERAEIVQRGNLHLACAHGIENTRHEADACAVAEFGVFKTEIANFAEHGATIGVAMRIPASRE